MVRSALPDPQKEKCDKAQIKLEIRSAIKHSHHIGAIKPRKKTNMTSEMIALPYGTKLAAYSKTTKRVVLASVVDTSAAFADWQIATIEQDKIAPDAVIASLEAAAAKSGSKIISL